MDVRDLWGRIGIKGAVIGVIIAAALLFILVNVIEDTEPERVDIAAGSQFPCTVLSVYDGDGPINCAEQDMQGKPVAVRLRGIEARETDDSCRPQELCPEMSGAEAKDILTRLAVGRLECTSHGPSYNRVDARCRNASGQDLSCEMIRSGGAMRWPEYDSEGELLACVPAQE